MRSAEMSVLLTLDMAHLPAPAPQAVLYLLDPSDRLLDSCFRLSLDSEKEQPCILPRSLKLYTTLDLTIWTTNWPYAANYFSQVLPTPNPAYTHMRTHNPSNYSSFLAPAPPKDLILFELKAERAVIQGFKWLKDY